MLRYSITGANDDTLDLELVNGVLVLPGVRGLDMPDPITRSTEPIGWDGGRHESARYGFREVFLPIEMVGTQPQLQALVARIIRILDVRRGPVTVTVAHRDGRKYTIAGMYAGGFDQDLPVGGGQWRHSAGITISCDDPYWQGEQRTIVFARGLVTVDPFLGEGFLPPSLSTAFKLGEIEIDVAGDAEAFPRWRVHGPGDEFTATDLTTGASWGFGELDATDELILDARRGVQTITLNGERAWNLTTTGSILWPLQPGRSAIELAISEIGAESVIELSYTPRFLSVWA